MVSSIENVARTSLFTRRESKRWPRNKGIALFSLVRAHITCCARNVKRKTKEALRLLNELERAGRVGSGTAARVRSSLEETLKFLGGFE